jgi:hypothetical protein
MEQGRCKDVNALEDFCLPAPRNLRSQQAAGCAIPCNTQSKANLTSAASTLGPHTPVEHTLGIEYFDVLHGPPSDFVD